MAPEPTEPSVSGGQTLTSAEALIRHLSGSAPAPAALAHLAGPELDLLRALCHGSPLRARLVAEHLTPHLTPDPAHPRHPPWGQDMSNDIFAPLTPGPPWGQDMSNDIFAPPTPRNPDIAPTPPAPSRSAWRATAAAAEADVLRLAALDEDLAVFGPLLGIGWHRAGTALTAVVHDRLAELRALLARAPELRRIAELLGRLREGTRPRRPAERGGRDETVGVTIGGELADVLPGELALLSTPETEDLFLARLVERRLVSLELTGPLGPDRADQRRRGPVLCLVDTSGSMMGAPAELAKAAALALIERVLADHRPVEVTLFGGEGATRTLHFARGRTTPATLFDFLMASFHGGTDFDGPILAALARARPAAPHAGPASSVSSVSLSDADLLLITDGRGPLAPATRARLASARKAGLRLVTALVDAGQGTADGGLAVASDVVLDIGAQGRVTRRTAPSRAAPPRR